jgi:crotonobetainyl-CoA:carnitine CoA-transferase CaiB-like acyl-CoA transferase
MLGDALNGIKILDLTQVAAGPLCTMLLADLGADVIKIEPPGGDSMRAMYPSVRGESTSFLAFNRNKRSVVLDLKDTQAKQAALRLAVRSDVVVESFRPGVASRLGLGWAELSAANPGLIYCSISAYGQDGPQHDQPGVDGVIQAVSGLMSVIGYPGGPPCKVQVPVVDVATGQLAALSVMAALARRQRDGRGQHVEISLYDSAMSLQQMALTTFFATGEPMVPAGSAAPYSAPNEALRCADGWIMVAAYNPSRWRALCDVIGAPDLHGDPRFARAEDRVRNRPQLVAALEARLVQRRRDEWIPLLKARDIICGPILDHREASASEQFQATGLAEVLEHTVLGSVKMPRSVLHAVGERPKARRAPPLLGEHTEQVLAQLDSLWETA